MNTLPLQFPLLTLSGWVNRSQQDVIEYLQEENWVLRGHLGGRRLLFTDAQRRRLAIKARRISRKALSGMGTVVTPDTLVRWYRALIARKYDGSRARKAGRPRTAVNIEQLIVRMTREIIAGATPGSEGHSAISIMRLVGTTSSESSRRTVFNQRLFVEEGCRGRRF
jgi:hypothetical protein